MKNCSRSDCKQKNPQLPSEFYNGYNNCKTCHKAMTRKRALKNNNAINWRKSNPNKVKGHWLRKYWPNLDWQSALYNFTKLVENQQNRCAICKQHEQAIDGKTKTVRDLSVDHCHKTGKVRGLLCSTCNRAIGYLKDDVKLCESAANYLKSCEQD